MSRQARLLAPGIAFHVTARGNYRQPVLFTDGDRSEYLATLVRYSAIESLAILGWCLMTNHIHLLVVPGQRASLARTLMRTQSNYAQCVNRRHGQRLGHLWQSRFYSCPLDGDAVWTVLRYIELNPVRAGLVERAEQSSWSSARFHCGLAETPPFLDLHWWQRQWHSERWQSVLALGAAEREAEAIRLSTQQGVPLGSKMFIEEFERQVGRSLVVRSPGRQRQLVLMGAQSVSVGE
jgi:putative transposase